MTKAIFPGIKMRASFATSFCCIAAALVLILSACSTSSTQTTTTTPATSNGSPSSQQPGDFGLAAVPGYQVSLFAHNPTGITGPDSLVVDNGFVYIDYQNTTAKDCTDKFTLNGKPGLTGGVGLKEEGER